MLTNHNQNQLNRDLFKDNSRCKIDKIINNLENNLFKIFNKIFNSVLQEEDLLA